MRTVCLFLSAVMEARGATIAFLLEASFHPSVPPTGGTGVLDISLPCAIGHSAVAGSMRGGQRG